MAGFSLKKITKPFVKWIGRSTPVLYIVGSIAYVYSWLVGKTSHFEIHGQQEFEDTITQNNGGIFVTWHGRALMLPFFWSNIRKMKALVSPHADGRIISILLKYYHILTIKGSSDRQAASAALDIINELNQGTVVALISDGPRGPRMRLNKSVIYFAQKTGKPIMGFVYSAENAKVMKKSWDAMLLPKLGQKGVIYGTKPMFVPADADENEKEALRRQFEEELNALTLAADEKCGIGKILPEDTKRKKRYCHKGKSTIAGALFVKIYKILMSLLFPLLYITYIRQRRKKGKEHALRFKERLGVYTHPRPEGKLVWMHGASVGEAISMLPLIDKMLEEDDKLSIMVTTGTLTSAEIMERRLPKRAFHQFIPFDVPKFAKRLLEHYKPDVAMWFESELWPSLLSETNRHHVPLILINGRISDNSFALWKRFKFAAQEILNYFALCLGQSEQDKNRLILLGAQKVECFGNIKYAGMPLPVDERKLAQIEEKIGDRKVFLISSTHHNEEEQLMAHFDFLLKVVPHLLIIVVPRHPNRGMEVSEMFRRNGYKTAQRSKAESIEQDTVVYVADTIGEMGLWYKIAPVTFVGGSLIPHGGQNFMEPARDKNAVIVGPYMHNFVEMLERAQAEHAVWQVQGSYEVIEEAVQLFNDQKLLEQRQNDAYQWSVKEARVLDGICAAVEEELK